MLRKVAYSSAVPFPQARDEIVSAIDNSTAAIETHINTTASAQLLVFDQGQRELLAKIATDTAAFLDALATSANATTTEVREDL
jgi:hypothetical protein